MIGTPFATITIRVFEDRPPAIETGWAGVDAPEQRERVVEALAGAERFFRVPVETPIVRDPEPGERTWSVSQADGTNWLARSFSSPGEAIDEAKKIGYGGPWFIREVVAVVE